MGKKYLTIDELAEYIGLSARTLRNWKYSRPDLLPPHVAIDTGGRKKHWRWDTEAVDQWMHREVSL